MVGIRAPSLSSAIRLLPLVALLLLTGACGAADDGTGASPSESRQLNEAAAAMDDSSGTANTADQPDKDDH